MNIPVQLRALGLDPFEGRQHSGIDVRHLILPLSYLHSD